MDATQIRPARNEWFALTDDLTIEGDLDEATGVYTCTLRSRHATRPTWLGTTDWPADNQVVRPDGRFHIDLAEVLAVAAGVILDHNAGDDAYERGDERYVRVGRVCLTASSGAGIDFYSHIMCETEDHARRLFAGWATGTEDCYAELAREA